MTAPLQNDVKVNSFKTEEALAFLFGLLIVFFVGFGSIASTLQSVAWRLNIQCTFREGRCRVVRAEVVETSEDGPFALEITHQLQVDGKLYSPTTWTEEERPRASSQAEAEAMLSNYQVGETYPCWYNAKDPEHNSVLIRDGLHPWRPIRYLWKSVLISIPGVLLCLWSLQRRRARQRQSETNSPESTIKTDE